jgi:hypothetical protein
MQRPRGLPLVAALGLVGAGVAFLRRGVGRRRERVDLYFDDGSMLSLTSGVDAERILDIARSAL